MTQIHHNLPDKFREPAIALYYEAFESKFSKLFTQEEALKILPELLNGEQAIYAVQDEALVGFAGVQHGRQKLFKSSLHPFTTHLGMMRGLLAAFVLSLFERPYTEGELLMDGICVDKKMRGQGVGSALLAAIYDFAREKGYQSIRLDVVDTNPKARKLYERIGFEAQETQRHPFTKKMLGFSASTRMVKKI